jgi:hypothetical protein
MTSWHISLPCCNIEAAASEPAEPGDKACAKLDYLPVYVVVPKTLSEEHDVAESAVVRPARWIATKRTECWCRPAHR